MANQTDQSVPQYAYYTPRAYVVIKGEKIDVSSVSIDYAMNSIPICQVSLPVGRTTTTNKPAAVHRLVSGLTNQTPMQVFATFGPSKVSDTNLPYFIRTSDPIKLFDGFTSGSDYSRGANSARYILAANGGLVKLTQASALSDSSHPANPARYSYGAITRSGDNGSLNNVGSDDLGAGRDWTIVTSAGRILTQGAISTDLWGSAIYKWLQFLTSQNGIWINEPNLLVDGTNKQAADALALLLPAGREYVPLKIRPNIEIGVDAARDIANDIALLTRDVSFTANQTIWDILVGHFAADYSFAVIPRPSASLIVPYIGAYRGRSGPLGRPYKTIEASDYTNMDRASSMLQPLRAYGILSSMLSRSGSIGFDTNTPASAKLGMGGWFDAGAGVDGAVMIQPGPRWMSSITNPSRWSGSATGGSATPISSAFNPGTGKTNTSEADAKTRAENSTKMLLDAFAAVRYAQETVRGRSLVISGPFRLDIGPGSLIEVECSPEQFVTDDQLGVSLIGDVQQVSLVIDAENQTCATSFHIGNVRNTTENETDRCSISAHPIYDKTFLGCSLVDL